ncbi:Beta-barrel assembly-enhancing protease [Thalassocella blandensis]|nr:Beta-barrel assembly-enhancing protease [Thalassocella blandensis]
MPEITEYACHGFHDDLPKGKASGSMRVDTTGVHCRIADKSVSMSYPQLNMYMGGASDRLVFFEHPSARGWSIYTSDRSVLNNPHFSQYAHLSSSARKAKQKHWLGWGIIAAVVCLIVVIPLSVVLKMDWVSKKIATKIPPAWEEQLGQSAIAQYRLQHKFLPQDDARKLLAPLVNPLIDAVPNSRFQYDFYIVNDSSLNAFALPGGDVVIHSQLILKAESAEEMLGVIAHEITHVEQQHGVRNVLGTAGIYVVASAVFGDVSGVLSVFSGAAPLLLNQSYSRKFEREADEKGYGLLVRANINPAGLASFFEKLIEEEKRSMEQIESEETREMVKDVLQFISTHPASEERVANLKALAQQDANATQSYRDLSVQFTQLQNAVKDFVTVNKNSEDSINESGN